jgi:predicted transcriptional regulator
MITKEKLIQVINNMPEKIYIDDIIEEFILLSKIEHGLADVESGRVYSDKKVEEKMAEWLK